MLDAADRQDRLARLVAELKLRSHDEDRFRCQVALPMSIGERLAELLAAKLRRSVGLWFYKHVAPVPSRAALKRASPKYGGRRAARPAKLTALSQGIAIVHAQPRLRNSTCSGFIQETAQSLLVRPCCQRDQLPYSADTANKRCGRFPTVADASPQQA